MVNNGAPLPSTSDYFFHLIECIYDVHVYMSSQFANRPRTR
jgi:hypothetical protein